MTSQTDRVRYWAIVPAAGVGRRMGGDVPKQYLSLAGRSVLEHTLQRLSMHPVISEIIVVLHEDDQHWQNLHLEWVARPIKTVIGGEERCHSVLNGLDAIARQAHERDWVLVHDAARPCIRPDDIEQLITHCRDDVGGILALPVLDTMKYSDDKGYSCGTVDRENLWHALTPQIYRYGELHRALSTAIENKTIVTDESMAMDLAGHPTRFVVGHADNIKITRPEDLALAEFLLKQQQAHGIGDFDDGMADGG